VHDDVQVAPDGVDEATRPPVVAETASVAVAGAGAGEGDGVGDGEGDGEGEGDGDGDGVGDGEGDGEGDGDGVGDGEGDGVGDGDGDGVGDGEGDGVGDGDGDGVGDGDGDGVGDGEGEGDGEAESLPPPPQATRAIRPAIATRARARAPALFMFMYRFWFAGSAPIVWTNALFACQLNDCAAARQWSGAASAAHPATSTVLHQTGIDCAGQDCKHLLLGKAKSRPRRMPGRLERGPASRPPPSLLTLS